ncbi:hypothetical protein [Tenacibaculum discolor]|uniref:hypothetical protein n=1 Tax=Tenacibaculum discolor TaxID=361581 RepID=UPI000EAC32B8|nr:hypothetical protein [Tenacibaculum discolor]RLK02972.1 hypothetical protein C8N27_0817 [Tenacibaculum discolor]
MKTVTFLIIFLGCYALYNTSEKAYLSNTFSLQKWFQSHKHFTNIIGLIFLLVGLLLSITFFGLSAGIITWIVAVSLFLSLIILITPLRMINYAFLTVLFTLTFLIELIF